MKNWQQGSSLRYSFGGGLGFNFWATYAYYLASPLKFLIVAFFPKRNMMDAMALLIVLQASDFVVLPLPGISCYEEQQCTDLHAA